MCRGNENSQNYRVEKRAYLEEARKRDLINEVKMPNGHIMQIIRESAHLFNNPTDQMGYGIPNFEDAYNALEILGNENNFLLSNFA